MTAYGIVTRLAILIGWFEIVLACLGGFLCVSNAFDALVSTAPEGERALTVAVLVLPVSILFAWAGWALIRRKGRAWQYQVILVIVVLLSAGIALIQQGA